MALPIVLFVSTAQEKIIVLKSLDNVRSSIHVAILPVQVTKKN